MIAPDYTYWKIVQEEDNKQPGGEVIEQEQYLSA